jgi:hypothetical protein
MVTIEYRTLAVLALFGFCAQASYDYTKEYISQCVSTRNAYHKKYEALFVAFKIHLHANVLRV